MKNIFEKIKLLLPIRIIDRYVLREFIIGYLIAITVVLSLRVLIDLFIFFDDIFLESLGIRRITDICNDQAARAQNIGKTILYAYAERLACADRANSSWVFGLTDIKDGNSVIVRNICFVFVDTHTIRHSSLFGVADQTQRPITVTCTGTTNQCERAS